MDRLTVLLPARNAANTIRTALMSVLRGISADTAVLVLNDASEDATGDVVADVAKRDRRVRTLKSESPLGVAGALNALIEASDTPVLARMDADDIALPWRFSCQMRALDRHRFDAVFSPIVIFGPTRTRVEPQLPLGVGPSASPYELLVNNSLMHPTLICRRECLVDAGGYRAVPAEDWDLWIRMALRGNRMARIAVPTLLYRRHASQVTASQTWKSSHTSATQTTQIHDDLSRRLLGFTTGAYPALSGVGGDPAEVTAAHKLIDELRRLASSFPLRDRLSIRATALIAERKLKRDYPTYG